MNDAITTINGDGYAVLALVLVDGDEGIADIDEWLAGLGGTFRLMSSVDARIILVNRMKTCDDAFNAVMHALDAVRAMGFDDVAYAGSGDGLLSANKVDGCGLVAGGIARRASTLMIDADTDADTIARIVGMVHMTCSGVKVRIRIDGNADIDGMMRSLEWIGADGFDVAGMSACDGNPDRLTVCWR